MFKAIDVTLADVTHGFLRVLRIHGSNHFVEACRYAKIDNDGAISPVCIVGAYLHMLGLLGLLVESPIFGEYDGHAHDPNQTGACLIGNNNFWGRLELMGYFFTAEAKDFMRDAQEVQDGGSTWGNAVEIAIGRAHGRAQEELPTHNLMAMVASVVNPEEPLADWEKELLDL